MEVVYKKLEELKMYENNARRNDGGVAKVADSIKNFGFLNPIVIDAENVIISGHTRFKAAQRLRLEEIPCIVKDMTQEEATLARIVDNKSHEYATWNIEKLHSELDEIGLTFKTNFFTVSKDRKFFTENKVLIFGNTELSINEEEYQRLKAVYDDYISRNKTFMGFVMYLTGGGED